MKLLATLLLSGAVIIGCGNVTEKNLGESEEQPVNDDSDFECDPTLLPEGDYFYLFRTYYGCSSTDSTEYVLYKYDMNEYKLIDEIHLPKALGWSADPLSFFSLGGCHYFAPNGVTNRTATSYKLSVVVFRLDDFSIQYQFEELVRLDNVFYYNDNAYLIGHVGPSQGYFEQIISVNFGDKQTYSIDVSGYCPYCAMIPVSNYYWNYIIQITDSNLLFVVQPAEEGLLEFLSEYTILNLDLSTMKLVDGSTMQIPEQLWDNGRNIVIQQWFLLNETRDVLSIYFLPAGPDSDPPVIGPLIFNPDKFGLVKYNLKNNQSEYISTPIDIGAPNGTSGDFLHPIFIDGDTVAFPDYDSVTFLDTDNNTVKRSIDFSEEIEAIFGECSLFLAKSAFDPRRRILLNMYETTEFSDDFCSTYSNAVVAIDTDTGKVEKVINPSITGENSRIQPGCYIAESGFNFYHH